MPLGAVGGVARQFDDFGAKQRRLADHRLVDALLLGRAQETRAFFLIEIDEHRVGVSVLHLDGVGGEVRLSLLGGDIYRDLDAALLKLGYDGIAAALAKVVVDPDHDNRFRLYRVFEVVRDLRHRRGLAERRAEDERIALLRQVGRLAADDLGDLGALRDLHRGADRAGEDRAEHSVGAFVDGALHGGARVARDWSACRSA